MEGVNQIDLSEFSWSVAATKAAKEKGGLVRYRSYRKGTYFDKISEWYNFIDLFELQAFHVPLDMEKVKWYRENEKEPLITPSGDEDGHIIALSREAHYADQGADYVILPMQLKVRRFRFPTNEDLELWKKESEEEGIIFVGPIPGISPVREILAVDSEDGRLIHQATSDRDEQIRQMVNPLNGTLELDTRTNPFFHDYEENFTASGPCGHFECPVCYGSLILFDKSRIFILGLSEDAPEVITVRVRDAKTKKLKYLLKLAKLSQMSMMLSEVTDSMDAIGSLNLSDYYDQLQ